MKSSIQYLPKPKIKPSNLPYLEEPKPKEIYVNLFQININKPLHLHIYPFTVTPEIGEDDFKIRNKLFRFCSTGEKDNKKRLRDIYGECFIKGNDLFAIKEIKEPKTFFATLVKNGVTEYKIIFQPKKKDRIINSLNNILII